ncbi:unnamed protein product [Rotaria magnacalcarata]|uniref:Cupin type-1 domain-containing protein n=1 Tax=Rotaria magnacalcarata TaxID=392030 RepID=A0A814YWH1_9BILA|nr:unnamed protein product [Rotaria magnacalcarata]CAF2217285.1 unnamed protein product [Rotaria magnacalcarata]
MTRAYFFTSEVQKSGEVPRIIQPCGVVLPHIYPRASQIYYIIKGEFELGFIEDNAANFTGHIIKEGQGTLFPQGSIHYFINTQCENSSLVAVASSEDPGRIDVATSFFKALPPSMISAALGGQKVKIDENKLPTVDPAQGTEECRRRCNLL